MCLRVCVRIRVRVHIRVYLCECVSRVCACQRTCACASPWTHPDEDEDEHGDEVVGPGHRVLVGQAQQVHDGGAHAQDGLHLVPRGLVGVDGPDLGLGGGPGGLAQVHLGRDAGPRVSDCVYMLEHNGVINVSNEHWTHVNRFLRSASPKGSSQDRISKADRIAGLDPVLAGYLPVLYLPACVPDRVRLPGGRVLHFRPSEQGL